MTATTRPIRTPVFLVAVLMASIIFPACGGGRNPGGPDPVPSPTPAPRADRVVYQASDLIENGGSAGGGLRAPEAGLYVIELAYTPGSPTGRADLELRMIGSSSALAKAEGDHQPKRLERRYEEGEPILVMVRCITGPVTAHYTVTLKGQ